MRTSPRRTASGFFVTVREKRQHMQRALELAAKGKGRTSPNPMVGAVIVKGGRVIAEGYHQRVGRDHAEIVTLKKAGAKAQGATLFVTLEPCCHTGRTGPCTEAIAAAGIARVIFASKDPDPRVNGKGARRLRRAGVKVEGGLLDREQQRLNEAYFTFHRTGRPFVLLKTAQTLDGFVATSSGDSQWITGKMARTYGHRLRAEADAVVAGAGTVRADNPALTVRHVRGRNPYRIVMTSSGKLPAKARLLHDDYCERTIVVTTRSGEARIVRTRIPQEVQVWTVGQDRNGMIDPAAFLQRAGEFGLRSLLIEGGPKLAASFLKRGLVDKLAVFTAPIILGKGLSAFGPLDVRRVRSAWRLTDKSVQQLGDDLLVIGYPERAA